ncbi:putative aspartate carbamoyltransferase [Cyclospora cayetanensis]|uniref:Aspartate carbamoyltransferase n=1 Tax=Cyclospora cayetanensis TaxID=88456 RepID=A0A1D3CSP1_9EIME|nr:putative aspartate carbamoyltransferase [Cyclospora cayetanensis]
MFLFDREQVSVYREALRHMPNAKRPREPAAFNLEDAAKCFVAALLAKGIILGDAAAATVGTPRPHASSACAATEGVSHAAGGNSSSQDNAAEDTMAVSQQQEPEAAEAFRLKCSLSEVESQLREMQLQHASLAAERDTARESLQQEQERRREEAQMQHRLQQEQQQEAETLRQQLKEVQQEAAREREALQEQLHRQQEEAERLLQLKEEAEAQLQRQREASVAPSTSSKQRGVSAASEAKEPAGFAEGALTPSCCSSTPPLSIQSGLEAEEQSRRLLAAALDQQVLRLHEDGCLHSAPSPHSPSSGSGYAASFHRQNSNGSPAVSSGAARCCSPECEDIGGFQLQIRGRQENCSKKLELSVPCWIGHRITPKNGVEIPKMAVSDAAAVAAFPPKEAAEALRGRSVVSVSLISTAEIAAILLAAQKLKRRFERGDTTLHHVLQGKVVATAFFEPSTRTRCSFEAAALRLGAGVISNADLKAASSVKKGESLSDTLRMFASYSDAVIMRHPDKGSCASISSPEFGFCSPVGGCNGGGASGSERKCVLLSGGDGCGEHPTQALLDLFTVAEQQSQWFSAAVTAVLTGCQEHASVKKPPQLSLVFWGDLKYGRTVHSLALLLARLSVRLFFVPAHGLHPDEAFLLEVKHIFKQQGLDPNAYCCLSDSLSSALPLCDFLYVTRVQLERMPTPEAPPLAAQGGTERSGNAELTITKAFLETYGKPDLKVLHPLPRVSELSVCVDASPFCCYFQQAANGLFVRMALLTLCLLGGVREGREGGA